MATCTVCGERGTREAACDVCLFVDARAVRIDDNGGVLCGHCDTYFTTDALVAHRSYIDSLDPAVDDEMPQYSSDAQDESIDSIMTAAPSSRAEPTALTVGTALGDVSIRMPDAGAGMTTRMFLEPVGGFASLLVEVIGGVPTITATSSEGRRVCLSLPSLHAAHLEGGLTPAELGIGVGRFAGQIWASVVATGRLQTVSTSTETAIYRCETPGCYVVACPGLRFCSSDCAMIRHLDQCLLLGCGRDTSSWDWWWCDKHGDDEGNFTGVETTRDSLVIARAFQVFLGNDGTATEAAEGDVRLPAGMPAEISTHGAPVGIDPVAMEAALRGLPQQCISGGCELYRAEGHAFCQGHLSTIKTAALVAEAAVRLGLSQ